jgi:hypothetical protein
MPTNSQIKEYFEPFKYKFGRNGAVGNSFEHIWSHGGTFAGFKDTAVQATITAGADDVMTSGSGAWKIEVSGIGTDADGNTFRRISEEIELNGATGVDTTKYYNFIRRIKVILAADDSPITGPNHAEILATEKGGSDIMAAVEALKGQTLMCMDQLPENEYGKLTDIHFYSQEVSTSSLSIEFYTSEFGTNSWNIFGSFQISNGVVVEKHFVRPQPLLPKTKVIAIAKTSVGSVAVSADFEWESILIED